MRLKDWFFGKFGFYMELLPICLLFVIASVYTSYIGDSKINLVSMNKLDYIGYRFCYTGVGLMG